MKRISYMGPDYLQMLTSIYSEVRFMEIKYGTMKSKIVERSLNFYKYSGRCKNLSRLKSN